MRLDRLKARMLLAECTGDDIWPVELCRSKGIPEAWIDELADAFESGYQNDRQTIYFEEKQVNQFHGVRDYDLAIRLAEYLGVRTELYTHRFATHAATVLALREAADDE